jgi:hypothetical protein
MVRASQTSGEVVEARQRGALVGGWERLQLVLAGRLLLGKHLKLDDVDHADLLVVKGLAILAGTMSDG